MKTAKSCMDPGGRFFRYLILFLLSYIKMAQFFCIEMPSGLQGTIIKVFKITAKDYDILFSSYTWPDIIMSILGGILIDRVIGVRAGYLLSIVVAIIGKGLVTIGAFANSFYVIFAGRFIMGCGLGTMNSVAYAFLALWFKDKEITFAMSVMSCGRRLGSSLGILLPQLIYENLDIAQYFYLYENHYRVGFTFLFSFALLFSSLFACMLIVILDIKGATALGRVPFIRRKFQSKDLKDFSLKYWISLACTALFYSVLFIFVANGQLFFTSRFGLSTKEANTANFLVFAIPVLITPMVGFLIEVIGFNILWGISGSLVAILTHILFNVLYEQSVFPYLLASLFSFSYALYATAISVLPTLIVQEHQLTTAYGLLNTAFCIIFTISSVIAGTIIDYAGFMWLEIFYVFLLSTILVLLMGTVLMEIFSTGGDKKVNKAGSLVKRFFKKLKFEKTEKKLSDRDGKDQDGVDQQGDHSFGQWLKELEFIDKSNGQDAHADEVLYNYND